MVKVHGGGGGGAGAACVIENVRLAAVIVAVRGAVPVLAATLNVTVPLPVPAEPPVIVTQVALAAALHAQLAADAVTAIEPVPPASARLCAAGEIEKVHAGGGAAACVSVNDFPATVIVAVRAGPVFA